MSEPAVSVDRLTRRFGDFVAVDGVSFTVDRGEVFGFLGPNGAGKTTTIKMLTGLLLPTSGSGNVAGFDLMTGAEQIKQSIGYMSQAFSLYGDLTVAENIDFFAGLYGVPRERRAERTTWVLETARLTDQRKRMVGDLSLGWKQRLALGCAVLHEPPLLFLDEPTSGVDPIARRHFWDVIYDLAERGTTVFVSTHYMVEAEFCDRLALMNRGRIIALDTPENIRGQLREPLFAISCSDSVRALRLLQKKRIVREAGFFGRLIHATVADARDAPSAIRRALEAEGIAVESIAPVAASLEDVFVVLVEQSGGVADA
ncbi:MAG TPA: ABC transporter ATP-binding protein [Thermoanaerobaculia bacterium]|nr:ABC transporter ATP-binding protein [Thermoanaerobaculia bacterium]